MAFDECLAGRVEDALIREPGIVKKKMNVDVWVNPLQIGEVLPTMPLRVVAGLFVPVELEETYATACRGRKLVV